MPPTVHDLVRLRDLLVPRLGEEATMILMQSIPPAPADQIATKADLRVLEDRLTSRLVMWMAGFMLSGMAMSAGISAAVASAIAG